MQVCRVQYPIKAEGWLPVTNMYSIVNPLESSPRYTTLKSNCFFPMSYWHFFNSAWRRPFISTCGTGFAAWMAGWLPIWACNSCKSAIFCYYQASPSSGLLLIHSHLLINSLERNQTHSVLFKVLFKVQVTRDFLVAKSVRVFWPLSSNPFSGF